MVGPPLWKILVNWDDYSQYIYIWENKNCSKPPTSYCLIIPICWYWRNTAPHLFLCQIADLAVKRPRAFLRGTGPGRGPGVPGPQLPVSYRAEDPLSNAPNKNPGSVWDLLDLLLIYSFSGPMDQGCLILGAMDLAPKILRPLPTALLRWCGPCRPAPGLSLHLFQQIV